MSILEIGLGGRLDAMNIVDPDVCVITSISMDHEAWLGNTRDAIALEKAGIMRSGVPCVVTDRQPPDTLLRHAASLGAPLLLIGREFDERQSTFRWTSSTGEMEQLSQSDGKLPPESLAGALQACSMLGLSVPTAQIAEIVTRTCVPGRAQPVTGFCETLLDVAHNPAAAIRFAQLVENRVSRLPSGTKVIALVGIYADKDVSGVLTAMTPHVSHWCFTDLVEARAEKADNLAASLRSLVDEDHVIASCYANIRLALAGIEQMCKPTDLLIVFGSFPVVAGTIEALDHLSLSVNL